MALTESSVERVASTIAAFFSCSCTAHQQQLKDVTNRATYLYNFTLYTILYHQLDDLDGSVLAQTMDTIHSLCRAGEPTSHRQTIGGIGHLRYSTCMRRQSVDGRVYAVKRTYRRIPPTVHQEDSGSLRQIQRHTSRLQADQEHSDVYIVHFIKSQ